MKKVLVIAGPTASGKSDFAVACAKRFGGEIISGDSIQVYRGMDIGSGKVTAEEKDGIAHHLLDIKDIKESYSVADFQQEGRKLIDQLDFPIIAGGTGLYLKACLYDYNFEQETDEEPVDAEFMDMDNESLYELLLKYDPKQAEKIHVNNRRRLQRSLTIYKRTGKPQSELESEQNHEPIYDIFIAGCTMDREVLYERINHRVELMFEHGLLEEVEVLLAKGYTFQDPGFQGIGYREFEAYFNGECDLEYVKKEIQKHSRQYAKRQYTWLNHQMPVHWFEVLDESDRERMLQEIEEWKRTN